MDLTKKINILFNESKIKNIIINLKEDLTNRLSEPLQITINLNLTYKEAKSLFKKHYIIKVLSRNYGNISKASKLLEIDRRSLHRLIDSLDIEINSIREEMLKPDYLKKKEIVNKITEVINEYKSKMPIKEYKLIYDKIDDISNSMIIFMDYDLIPLNEAIKLFEKRYFTNILENEQKNVKDKFINIKKLSKKIHLSYENIIRKLNELGIKH